MYLGATTKGRGVVAGPIAKSCPESIIPILNGKKTNSSIEYAYRYGLDTNLITVGDYVGKIKINKQYSVNYLVIGVGDTIISQSHDKEKK